MNFSRLSVFAACLDKDSKPEGTSSSNAVTTLPVLSVTVSVPSGAAFLIASSNISNLVLRSNIVAWPMCCSTNSSYLLNTLDICFDVADCFPTPLNKIKS